MAHTQTETSISNVTSKFSEVSNSNSLCHSLHKSTYFCPRECVHSNRLKLSFDTLTIMRAYGWFLAEKMQRTIPVNWGLT